MKTDWLLWGVDGHSIPYVFEKAIYYVFFIVLSADDDIFCFGLKIVSYGCGRYF